MPEVKLVVLYPTPAEPLVAGVSNGDTYPRT